MMNLITGVLALLLDYVGQDRCTCEDAGTCTCCVATRALAPAEWQLATEFTAANQLSGPALQRFFEAPVLPAPDGASSPQPIRVLVARAHSANPDHTPDNCDFAVIRVAPELAQVLLAYRDELDCLIAGVRDRFPAAASLSYSMKVYPPCWVDFLGMPDALPPGDALLAAAEAVIENDSVVLLPSTFDPTTYAAVTARTDADHCRLSRDGVVFAAYASETLVSSTEVGWDQIELAWSGA